MSLCHPKIQAESCRKKHVITKLKDLLKEIEDGKICKPEPETERTKQERTKPKTEDDKDYQQLVTLDGQLSEKVPKISVTGGYTLCPPCNKFRQQLEPFHSCYRQTGVSKTGGHCEEDEGYDGSGDRNAYKKRDGLEHGDCKASRDCDPSRLPVVGNDGCHDEKCVYMKRKNDAKTEVGGSCPHKTYYCPEIGPKHKHWSPPLVVDCKFPNTCVATCFDHPFVKDWNTSQPNYRYFMENIYHKPF